MYHSVHVMKDDVDELHGKKPSNVQAEQADAVAASEAEHPFLRSDSPFGESGMLAVAPAPVAESVSADTVPKPEKKPLDKRYYIYGGVAILIIAVIGAAAYYFLVIRKRSQSVPAPQTTETPATSAPTGMTTPDQPVGYYSLTNPNTLALDVESDAGTPAGVRKLLSDASAKVLSMQTTVPVEFVIVDKSNAPIAFSRFAYLSGVKLPDDLLSLAGESFTIYMVAENGVVRSGVAMDVTDERKMADAVKSVEATLPVAFQSILYKADTMVPAQVTFRDGMFGTVPTRYAIVDDATGTSFDHVVLGKKLVIGTSKLTFDAILTKLVQGVVK